MEKSDQDLLDGLTNVFGAIGDEPVGAAHEMVGQLPNSGVAMGGLLAGGYAGAKIGAVLGAATGIAAPAAIPILSTVGAFIGMFVGNSAIEIGAKAVEAADDGNVTDQEMRDSVTGGAIKGLVIAGVDMAALGLSRVIMAAPGRAVEKAVTASLAKDGVDVANGEAVKAALKNADIANRAKDAAKAAFDSSMTKMARAKRGAAGFALETTGEGGGDYAGTVASGDDASATEAVLESIMAAPMSISELHVAKKLTDQGKNTKALFGEKPQHEDAADLLGDDPDTDPGSSAPPQNGVQTPAQANQQAINEQFGVESPDLVDHAAANKETPEQIRQQQIDAQSWEGNGLPSEPQLEEYRNGLEQTPVERRAPPGETLGLGANTETGDLSGIPDSLISEFPDFQLTLEGLLPINNLKPDEQRSLREAGLVQRVEGNREDGTDYSYEAVDPEPLWKEREARWKKQKEERKGPTEQEISETVERRARVYDRLADEQESLGDLADRELIDKYRAKAAEIRSKKPSVKNNGVDAAPIATQSQPAQPETDKPDRREPEQNAVGGLPVTELPVDGLRLSEDVPQFKDGANKDGVVEPLGGSFDRRGVAPIQVWERTDGSLEVISGRHRLDLARRSGERTIPAQVHREVDGFDREQAASLDAELNIRDNQGKAKDYVQYFQTSGITEKEANDRGLLSRALGNRSWKIATRGSEETIAAHRADVISDEAAERVASAAPNDSRLQAVGLSELQRGSSIANAVNMMHSVSTMGGGDASIDMFGFDDSAIKRARDMARLATAKQREISEKLRPQKAVSKAGDKASQEGITDKLSAADRKKRIDELTAEREAWDSWSTNPDLVATLNAELDGTEPEAANGVQVEPEAESPQNGLAFDLEPQTESDLQTKQAQEDEARQAEIDAEQKAQADAEVDMFDLTGSDRQRDQNPNQVDLLDITDEQVGDDIFSKARSGDKDAQDKLREFGLSWDGNKTKYRITSKEEAGKILSGETVESNRGHGVTDITDNTDYANVSPDSDHRITFKQTDKFDSDIGGGSIQEKNKSKGEYHLRGGYSIDDVATIEKRNSDGSWSVIYDANSAEKPPAKPKSGLELPTDNQDEWSERESADNYPPDTENIIKRGADTASPWLMSNGDIIPTGGDHVAFAGAMGYEGYKDFQEATGAIRASFYANDDNGNPPLVTLHLMGKQKLTKQQYDSVSQFLENFPTAQILVGVQTSGKNIENPEYKEIGRDDLQKYADNGKTTNSVKTKQDKRNGIADNAEKDIAAEWDALTQDERTEISRRAGWETKAGAPNYIAKRHGKQAWVDLPKNSKDRLAEVMRKDSDAQAKS